MAGESLGALVSFGENRLAPAFLFFRWVPEALEAGLASGALRRGHFRYLGLDIAFQPIEPLAGRVGASGCRTPALRTARHLRRKHRDSELRFEVADGVEE